MVTTMMPSMLPVAYQSRITFDGMAMVPNHPAASFPVNFDNFATRIHPLMWSPTDVGKPILRASDVSRVFNTSSLSFTPLLASPSHTNITIGYGTSMTSRSSPPVCSETLPKKPPSSFLIADILQSSNSSDKVDESCHFKAL